MNGRRNAAYGAKISGTGPGCYRYYSRCDRLSNAYKQYDMVFLDAAKGQYPEMLPDCLRLLKRGGLLVADNVLFKGLVAGDDTPARKHRTIVNRMRAFLEDLRNNPELETCIVPAGDGVAVAYKLLEEEMEQ